MEALTLVGRLKNAALRRAQQQGGDQ